MIFPWWWRGVPARKTDVRERESDLWERVKKERLVGERVRKERLVEESECVACDEGRG
jgi:hypothetical protein